LIQAPEGGLLLSPAPGVVPLVHAVREASARAIAAAAARRRIRVWDIPLIMLTVAFA
jgi:hypothetical protein